MCFYPILYKEGSAFDPIQIKEKNIDLGYHELRFLLSPFELRFWCSIELYQPDSWILVYCTWEGTISKKTNATCKKLFRYIERIHHCDFGGNFRSGESVSCTEIYSRLNIHMHNFFKCTESELYLSLMFKCLIPRMKNPRRWQHSFGKLW